MRFAVTLLLAGFVSASLYQRQSYPECALTCIASADLDGCSSTDTSCLCNSSTFVNSAYSCMQTTCSSDDLESAIAFAQSTCESVGVTLTDTSIGSATGSATSGGASATSTSPTTGTSASASSSATATESSSGAKQTGIPVLAAVGLGLAAFAL